MVILGIDPGLAHTGWGVIETRASQSRARAYGCITTSSDEQLDQRLAHIFREIQQVVHTYQPTELGIESVYFGHNTSAAILTAQARGAALVACSSLELNVGEYTPIQIKQSVVGAGRAEKHQVMYMTAQILKLDHLPKPDHAADALAAALTHAHSLHMKHQLGR